MWLFSGDFEGIMVEMVDQITSVIEDVLKDQPSIKIYLGAIVDFHKLIDGGEVTFSLINNETTMLQSTNVREFVTEQAIQLSNRIDKVRVRYIIYIFWLLGQLYKTIHVNHLKYSIHI